MNPNSLTAISPIDGRYRKHVEALDRYFSEYALIRYRLYVEVEYFIALVEQNLPQLKSFDRSKLEELRNVYRKFSEVDAQRIKEIEKTTNHDVKAVEYLLREKFQSIGCGEFVEFIHFGLTSQDINNTAVPLSFKLALRNEFTPTLALVIDKLKHLALEWKDIPMLAHTHGQPASRRK